MTFHGTITQGCFAKPRCFAARLGLGLLLFACAGCVRESTEGATSVFQYELWVPVSVLLAGIAAAPAGLAVRMRSARLGWVLLIGGPLAAVMFAPSLYRDQVTVSDEGFHVRTGIWGLTAVHDVRFAEVSSLSITAEETVGRRGRKKTTHYFVCDLKQGGQVKVPINNGVTEAAAKSILEHAAGHEIPILNET